MAKSPKLRKDFHSTLSFFHLEVGLCGYVGGASTIVEDSDAIESGVGIMSLGVLQAEIHLGVILPPPLDHSRM